MPDTRTHRGPDPDDARLFAAEALPTLRQATGDLGWLLNRGYAARSAVELVGNRYTLAVRQRLAVIRSSCSDEQASRRRARRVDGLALSGQELWIDGLNVLTGLEVALSGGVILVGRDGCCRDVAGLHRHYRKVEETEPAVRLVGEFASSSGVSCCRWWLDKPVSNSGRLQSLILDVAARAGWDWSSELAYNPDAILAKSDQVVATADSAILDRCGRWCNLARMIIGERIPAAWIVDLSSPDSE